MSRELQGIKDKDGTGAVTLEQAELDVAVSVEIEAESRRVLYALTIAEYMEAWLQMPGTEKFRCSPDPRHQTASISISILLERRAQVSRVFVFFRIRIGSCIYGRIPPLAAPPKQWLVSL